MSTFEQGFAEVQRAADTTAKAATGLASIAKQLSKAARQGDIGAIRRLTDRLARWNPATERQAEDRAHRLGQTQPVTVYAYTCLGTIEERIRDILARKQRLFDDVVDGVSLDLTRRLDAAELRSLVGL